MRFEVSFAYGAHVVAHRQRNPRLRGFLGRAFVDVPDVTAAEAPAALRVTSYRDRRRELRLHEGRLYEAASAIRDGAPADAEALLREAAQGWRAEAYGAILKTANHITADNDRFDLDEIRGDIAGDPGVAKVVKTEFERRAAEVRAAAAELLLVDGKVHRLVEEPVYVLSQSWLGVQSGDSDNYSADARYRADEREQAASTVLDPLPEHTRIEVLLPDAIRAPLPQLALAEIAQGLQDTMAENLAAVDVEAFAAFARLRDGLVRARADVAARGDRAVLHDLVGALEAALDAFGSRYPTDARHWHSHHAERVGAAVDRYRAFHPAGLDALATP